MRMKKGFGEKGTRCGYPDEVRGRVGRNVAEDLAEPSGSGCDEKNAKGCSGEMVFEAARSRVVIIGSELMVHGCAALRATVQLEKEANGMSIGAVLRVAIRSKSEAILVERTPERVVLVDPSEELIFGIVARGNNKFDVDGVHGEEVRDSAISKLKGLLAAGEHFGVV